MKYYLLGLFATDGSLRKYQWKNINKTSYSVCLEIKDSELIEKIALIFKINIRHRERTINNKKHDFYAIELGTDLSKKYVKHLKDKPNMINDFKKMSDKNQNNFMRGAFDGDGGVCYKKNQKLRAYLCANSKDGLDKIYEYWFNINNIVYSKYFDKRGAGAYNYNVGKQSEVQKMAKLMYSSKNIYLKRKHDIFLNNGFLVTEM